MSSTAGRSRRFLAAALGVAVLAGAGAGAAIYATVGGETTRTVSVTTQALATSPVAATTGSQLTVGQIYAGNEKGVVEIDVTGTGGSQSFPFGGGPNRQSQAQGTGFVYDTKGNIITNAHVVQGASSISVVFGDGASYKATVVGSDASTDIAVIKVNAPASELHPLTLGDSSTAKVGDGVVAIGDPFGLDNTVTSGIVSAVGRQIQAPNGTPIVDTIQTDAAINHGNSGGPLLDLQGKVIGVTSQIESDSGGNDGIGFAVASNTVKRIVSQLVANGKAGHALLGISPQTIPAQVAATLGTKPGVAVATVESGSGAAKAGLKAATGSKTVGGQKYPTGGDVIVAFDGTELTTSEQLRALVDEHQPGETVTLTVARGDQTRTVQVKLGSR